MRFGGRARYPSAEREGVIQRTGRVVRNLFAGFALVVFLVTVFPVASLWTNLLRGGGPVGRGKVMVLLTGSGLDEFLGETSYRRSACAAAEAIDKGYERIIISGRGGDIKPASTPMKAYLVAAGVEAGIIELEDRSVSTRENAQFSAKLLRSETRPIAIVTSDYHMYRSAKLFAKEGIAAMQLPCADAAVRAVRWRSRWEVACELTLETVKVAYYKLRGWI